MFHLVFWLLTKSSKSSVASPKVGGVATDQVTLSRREISYCKYQFPWHPGKKCTIGFGGEIKKGYPKCAITRICSHSCTPSPGSRLGSGVTGLEAPMTTLSLCQHPLKHGALEDDFVSFSSGIVLRGLSFSLHPPFDARTAHPQNQNGSGQ